MSHDPPLRSLLDPRLWRHPECRQGVRDMARVVPGMMAWGLVTGVAMTTSGLPLGVVLCLSLLVFAASAQLSSVPLLLVGAPLWVVWMTALCVNLRFVIFSAQLRPHMMTLPLRWRLMAGYLSADVTYVLTVHRHGQSAPASAEAPAPLAYFVGAAAVNWAGWNVASLAGILFASQVPAAWGLAFAGTLALLALLVTLLKDRVSVSSTALAGVAAVLCFSLPFRLHIVVAVMVAVAAGLWLERMAALKTRPAAGKAGA
ncbi:MAG: AzlC family ABC transporter permease [Proteobacteria bacterium]|uniref:AzlC family ABC transporter permease n=1 Tax=Aquabacterium sp. TaxID=1872578 RepID=UPI0035C749A2|nr:AzlC family ABC transporter permease [Pseudomonadota bacterium]